MLTTRKFLDMMDMTIVQSKHSFEDADKLLAIAKEYKPFSIHALPDLTPYLLENIKDTPEVKVGVPIGYPGGGHMTETKVLEVKQMLALGDIAEFDMVIKVGLLKSKQYKEVVSDISAVKEACGDKKLKVIIEAPVLTDDEVMAAAKCVLDGGADFVKTGTGWCGPTEVRHIDLIKKAIGDQLPIKAASGIKTLELAQQFYDAGIARYGAAYTFTLDIVKELQALGR